MTSEDASAQQDRRGIRLVLTVGIVTGLAMPIFFFTIAAENPIGWDFMAYLQAAENVLAGEEFIGVSPPTGDGQYVYPPIVVVLFIPYALIGDWSLSFILHGILNVVLLGLLGRLMLFELSRLGITLDRRDSVLITLFALVSLYPMVTIGQGQLDALVAVLLAGTFIALEEADGRIAGGLLAIAAGLKVFPAAFGVYFLRRRAWRAVLASIAGGLAIAIASVASFGIETHLEYITFLTGERSRLEAFAEGVSPDFFAVTLIRPLSELLSFAPPIVFLVAAIALVLPLLFATYRRLETRIDRHFAFLATITAILIASPSTNLNHLLYLYFPLVVLLYSLPQSRTRLVLAIGLGVMSIPLQPVHVREAVTTLLGSEGVFAAFEPTLRALLGFASIALVGAVLILIGCYLGATDRTLRSHSLES